MLIRKIFFFIYFFKSGSIFTAESKSFLTIKSIIKSIANSNEKYKKKYNTYPLNIDQLIIDKLLIIDESSENRSSGFPVITLDKEKNKTIIAWTENKEKFKIKTALVDNLFFYK